jgi:hypothetical protein
MLTRDARDEEKKRREKERMENRRRDEEELQRKVEKFIRTNGFLVKDESEEEIAPFSFTMETPDLFVQPEVIPPLTTTTTTTTSQSTARHEIPDGESDFQKHPAARQESMDTNESYDSDETRRIALTNNNNRSRDRRPSLRRRQESRKGEESSESPVAAPPKRTKMDVEEQVTPVHTEPEVIKEEYVIL